MTPTMGGGTETRRGTGQSAPCSSSRQHGLSSDVTATTTASQTRTTSTTPQCLPPTICAQTNVTCPIRRRCARRYSVTTILSTMSLRSWPGPRITRTVKCPHRFRLLLPSQLARRCRPQSLPPVVGCQERRSPARVAPRRVDRARRAPQQRSPQPCRLRAPARPPRRRPAQLTVAFRPVSRRPHRPPPAASARRRPRLPARTVQTPHPARARRAPPRHRAHRHSRHQ